MSVKTLRPWIPVVIVGVAFLAVTVVIGLNSVSAAPEPSPVVRATEGGLPGPDVTVRNLTGTNHYGEVGGIHGYSVGTDSCNIGSEPVNWCDNGGGCSGLTPAQHPVIAQNMYRLADGRFEQIGMSWLKHGFLSLNTNVGTDCQGINPSTGNPTTGCIGPSRGGNELGIGCTDIYGPGLNGSQPLGRRSEVNVTTGAFPFPPGGGGTGGTIGQRIQVQETDLTVAGARFWVEGQYIADDDALAGNGFNNASYREVSVNQSSFDLNFLSPTVRERAAIFAWLEVDSEVEIVAADYTPSSAPIITERFNAARRVTNLGGGQWRYVYAIHNMNSDRSGRSFTVEFPAATSFSNVGFNDVDHHSNEPYDTTDWSQSLAEGSTAISWNTDEATVNPNANALRWGTMFTFWFDADQPPSNMIHTLGLFKDAPGEPTSIDIPFSGGLSNEVFTDGFESGNTVSWSSTVSP